MLAHHPALSAFVDLPSQKYWPIIQRSEAESLEIRIWNLEKPLEHRDRFSLVSYLQYASRDRLCSPGNRPENQPNAQSSTPCLLCGLDFGETSTHSLSCTHVAHSSCLTKEFSKQQNANECASCPLCGFRLVLEKPGDLAVEDIITSATSSTCDLVRATWRKEGGFYGSAYISKSSWDKFALGAFTQQVALSPWSTPGISIKSTVLNPRVESYAPPTQTGTDSFLSTVADSCALLDSLSSQPPKGVSSTQGALAEVFSDLPHSTTITPSLETRDFSHVTSSTSLEGSLSITPESVNIEDRLNSFPLIDSYGPTFFTPNYSQITDLLQCTAGTLWVTLHLDATLPALLLLAWDTFEHHSIRPYAVFFFCRLLYSVLAMLLWVLTGVVRFVFTYRFCKLLFFNLHQRIHSLPVTPPEGPSPYLALTLSRVTSIGSAANSDCATSYSDDIFDMNEEILSLEEIFSTCEGCDEDHNSLSGGRLAAGKSNSNTGCGAYDVDHPICSGINYNDSDTPVLNSRGRRHLSHCLREFNPANLTLGTGVVQRMLSLLETKRLYIGTPCEVLCCPDADLHSTPTANILSFPYDPYSNFESLLCNSGKLTVDLPLVLKNRLDNVIGIVNNTWLRYRDPRLTAQEEDALHDFVLLLKRHLMELRVYPRKECISDKRWFSKRLEWISGYGKARREYGFCPQEVEDAL